MDIAQISHIISYNVCSATSPNFFAFGLLFWSLGYLPLYTSCLLLCCKIRLYADLVFLILHQQTPWKFSTDLSNYETLVFFSSHVKIMYKVSESECMRVSKHYNESIRVVERKILEECDESAGAVWWTVRGEFRQSPLSADRVLRLSDSNSQIYLINF